MELVSSMALQTTLGKPPFKYLGVTNDGSIWQGQLGYSTDAVLSKCAKFDVENAHGGLVHIRSCLTNKYWVRSSTNDESLIVAKGLKPDADTKSWTCTLFRMEVDKNKIAKFYHVQSGCVLRVPYSNGVLTIDDNRFYEIALSRVVDYDTLVVLPKYVAFKGSNDLYFNNGLTNDTTHAFSLTDIGHPYTVCEIKYTNDGRFRVKAVSSTHSYWAYSGKHNSELISCFRPDDTPPLDFLFEAIKVDKNKIALRCIANNKICTRADDYKGWKNRLVAIESGLTRDTHLEIVEPVMSRTYKLYEFDLDNARIYNPRLLYSSEYTWDNSSDVAQSSSPNGTIRTTKTRSYNNSITVSGKVSATIKGGVPFIASGEVTYEASVGYEHQWGHTIEESQQVGGSFTVVMKPMKTTRARGVATMASCDVPFSYVQKDYPTNGGSPIITKLYDGVFTGANAYNFYSQVWYEELPPEKRLPQLAAAKMCVQRPMVAAAK